MTHPQVFVAGEIYPSFFTPDGRQVAAVSFPSGTADIVMVTVEPGQAHVQPLIQTALDEQWPALSPDGRWLAYGSNVSGRNEVYVQPYPGPGPAEQVSTEEGTSPAWNPKGRELFYVSPADPVEKNRVMAVDFVPGSPPRIGRPHVLFEVDNRNLAFQCAPVRCFDVAPDGANRFYRISVLP